MIRVLLVDDEAAVRRGLCMQLALEPDLQVIGEAGDGWGAIELAKRLHPDVVVMDIRMRGLDGLSTVARLSELEPELPVVMLTLQDDCKTRAAAEAAGCRGFVGKHESFETLLATIRAVVSPEPPAGSSAA
ncbi:MAG: response regulator transcription factor [Hyphomicrobiales bacterium]